MHNVLKERASNLLESILIGSHEMDRESLYAFILEEARQQDDDELWWLNRKTAEYIIDISIEICLDGGKYSFGKYSFAGPKVSLIKKMVEEYFEDYRDDTILIISFGRERSDRELTFLEYILLVSDFTVDELNEILHSEDEINDDMNTLDVRAILSLNENLSKESQVFLGLN